MMGIRPAMPEEAPRLSDLAFRSKSYWPYPKNQIEEYKSELEVFTEDILSDSVFVLEVDQSVVGSLPTDLGPLTEVVFEIS
ncbi:MAG: hypothetical protein ACKOX6_12430 [Bdellovibrio sp.]